jgi:hypothetical protein
MRTIDKVLWAMGLTGIALGVTAYAIDPQGVFPGIGHTPPAASPSPKAQEEAAAQKARLDGAETIRRAEEHGAAEDTCPDVTDPMEHMRCFLAGGQRTVSPANSWRR